MKDLGCFGPWVKTHGYNQPSLSDEDDVSSVDLFRGFCGQKLFQPQIEMKNYEPEQAGRRRLVWGCVGEAFGAGCSEPWGVGASRRCRS